MNKLFRLLVIAALLAAPSGLNAEIDGKAEGGNIKNEAAKVQSARIKKFYESHEFVLPNTASDFDLKVQQNAFRATTSSNGGTPRAHLIIIRTDQDITFKLNSTANDSITLTAAEGVIALTVTEVTNIFLTVPGGVDANVKILLS